MLCALLVGAPAAHCEAPSGTQEIVLGMSTVLSGAASDLGRRMKTGVDAAIARANRSGGVHGRAIRLVALDDGYEPVRTVPNMRQLIERENVLAVIGNVGTPTAIAATPIAVAEHTLFFAAYSGSDGLRPQRPERYVINYRASYSEEATAMIDALIDRGGLAPEDIAFFIQDDGYGDSGFRGVMAALRRHGLRDESSVVRVSYKRNTLDVEDAVASLLIAPHTPRAIAMVGAYAPCAKFIRLCRDAGIDPLFLNLSFVGSSSLAAALGKTQARVMITQVVPHPDARGLPLIADFREDLNRLDRGAEPTVTSLEGYVSMRILTRALESMKEPPTREGIIDALNAMGSFDMGIGESLRLSPQEHQACHRVWPTVMRGGTFVPIDWSELRSIIDKESPL